MFQHEAVICDFECARFLMDTSDFDQLTDQQQEYHQSLCGARLEDGVRWFSPEILQTLLATGEVTATPQGDAWAMGMVLVELLTKYRPWRDLRHIDIRNSILAHEEPKRMNCGSLWMSEDAWGLVKRCTACRPEDRPSMEDVAKELRRLADAYAPPFDLLVTQVVSEA